MKEFLVKSKGIVYYFSIDRKINICTGDSATGKSMLCDLVRRSKQDDSGIIVEGNLYTVTDDNTFFELCSKMEDTTFLLDENSKCVESKEFETAIVESSNDAIIFRRKGLPYAISSLAIFEFIDLGNSEEHLNKAIRPFRKYCSLYSKSIEDNIHVLTEDSEDGFLFWIKAIGKNVVSSQGNWNLINSIKQINKYYIVVADSEAIGNYIKKISIVADESGFRIFTPICYEYMILNGWNKYNKNKGKDIIVNTNIDKIEYSRDIRTIENWFKILYNENNEIKAILHQESIDTFLIVQYALESCNCYLKTNFMKNKLTGLKTTYEEV